MKRTGIIVAVIVGIILVLFVIFCVTHPNETKQVPEGNATNHPSAPSSASQSETIDTVDRIVKETLGSDVIETRFEDDTYYILMKVNGVDSAFTIIASELNDALDGLSERINDSFSVDCVIFVVDDPSAGERTEEPVKPFALPPANKDMRRVFAYLIKHRGIARDVVAHFAKAGLLYEDGEAVRKDFS